MEMFDIKFDSSFVGKNDKRKKALEEWIKTIQSGKSDTVVIMRRDSI